MRGGFAGFGVFGTLEESCIDAGGEIEVHLPTQYTHLLRSLVVSRTHTVSLHTLSVSLFVSHNRFAIAAHTACLHSYSNQYPNTHRCGAAAKKCCAGGWAHRPAPPCGSMHTASTTGLWRRPRRARLWVLTSTGGCASATHRRQTCF